MTATVYVRPADEPTKPPVYVRTGVFAIPAGDGTGDMLAATYDPQGIAGDTFDRALQTGTQTAATISDLTEAVQDAVAALLGAGSNVTLTYDDALDTLTIASTGGGSTDPEAVRDAIGIALVGVGNISVAVDDVGDTITISTTATVNATDAQLRDRATHTGAQAIATVTGLQTALDARIPAAEKGAANGVATLGADSKIPSAQLPAIALGEVHVVADIAARDLLAVQEGDVAKVTGTGETFIYDGTAWVSITTSSAVDTVNGESGTVVLTTGDVAEDVDARYMSDVQEAKLDALPADPMVAGDVAGGDLAGTYPNPTLAAGVGVPTLAGAHLPAIMVHNGTDWGGVRPSTTDYPAGTVTWSTTVGNEPIVGDGSGYVALDLVAAAAVA